jgi:predicted ATPase
MLCGIHVSGFKSLEGFQLDFRKGLNVIVGPNGSGKTNIIAFIEFLSFLARDSLLDAVSKSGGAGRIFRRDRFGALNKCIAFTIGGQGTFQDFLTDKRHSARYEYSADIMLSESNSTLFYRRQRLKLSHQGELFWRIDIEVFSEDPDNVQLIFHHHDDDFLLDMYRRPKKDDVSEVKASILEISKNFARGQSICQIFDRYVLGARLVSSDLWRARSYNIAPSTVRAPEDIASEPIIAPDGTGLAATLFALTNVRRDYRFYPHPVQHTDDPNRTLNKILTFSRVVNEAIRKIDVEPDTIENKLRVFIHFEYEGGYLRLPFSLVSDGTAKWFTLVTAILTSPALFAIEEPENYLHPLMQKEIVNIVRSTFSGPDSDGFAVMTTHSETIFNSVDPSEIILIRMDQGKTIASRTTNADDIREQVRSTGFGAGYYYIAGAFE